MVKSTHIRKNHLWILIAILPVPYRIQNVIVNIPCFYAEPDTLLFFHLLHIIGVSLVFSLFPLRKERAE